MKNPKWYKDNDYLKIKDMNTSLKMNREKHRGQIKSLKEEMTSSYLNENYYASFTLAYIHVATPLVIITKNDKKIISRVGDAISRRLKDKYNFNRMVNKSNINGSLKEKLNKTYYVKSRNGKGRYLTISQIRNFLHHPEDDNHECIIEKANFKEISKDLILLSDEIYGVCESILKSSSDKKRERGFKVLEGGK